MPIFFSRLQAANEACLAGKRPHVDVEELAAGAEVLGDDPLLDLGGQGGVETGDARRLVLRLRRRQRRRDLQQVAEPAAGSTTAGQF